MDYKFIFTSFSLINNIKINRKNSDSNPNPSDPNMIPYHFYRNLGKKCSITSISVQYLMLHLTKTGNLEFLTSD